METNSAKIQQKSAMRFYCNFCDYGTDKKCNFDTHLISSRHSKYSAKETNGNKIQPKFSKIQLFCDNCQKIFHNRSGLWKHKNKCYSENCQKETTTDKDIIMMLIKEHSEIKSLIMEVLKNGTNNNNNNITNSHNKAFNLQFFLNETCKNAMNIMDFADSIQLQLSDLESVGELGYVEGISNIIVKNLKALDITKRPIHCADKKREVLYIKDEDKWEKEDDDKKNIKKVIKKVACKNQRLLTKFKEVHPGCNYSESNYSDKYSKLVIEAMGGSGNNDDEKEAKIIKNISKEVVIDKNVKEDT
jgi:hypothetical protein